VLVDADETFFACTLIRNPGVGPIYPRITSSNYFAGVNGSRLRADSVYACHLKVRSLRKALGTSMRDAGSFDRVFVVCPNGGWLRLAEILKSHGLAELGSRLDDPGAPRSESDVWGVKWNYDAKNTMLVVVSPACGGLAHKDLFVMHCMLHNLRESAQASKSDVRFTIGAEDAALLASEDVSPEGPRWTKTRDIFAPFYESSPYVELKVGPVAIRGDRNRGTVLDTSMLETTLASKGSTHEDAELSVLRSGDRLVAGRVGASNEVDVVLIVKREYADRIYINNGGVRIIKAAHALRQEGLTRLETWQLVEQLAGYGVYVPTENGAFGVDSRRRKKWV
jgi:hypothetical protein